MKTGRRIILALLCSLAATLKAQNIYVSSHHPYGIAITPAPEPSTYVLAGLGVAMLLIWGRRD